MFEDLHDALTGINVLAVVGNIPGPLAAARLRMLGARVVKIEVPSGDPLELASPAWYAQNAAGVEVLRLDLRDEVSRRALFAHVANADVVMTAMRARSVEKLGLTWERLHPRNPRAVLITLSGEAPPHDDRAGHDLTYQARAGTIAPPAMPRTLVGDMAAAERLVAVTLAALYKRERTGMPTHARVNITDCANTFAEPYRHGLTSAGGALGGGLPTYDIYECARGFIALAALEPHFIDRLQTLLGVDDLDRGTLQRTFRQRDASAWERLAEEHDIPLAEVR